MCLFFHLPTEEPEPPPCLLPRVLVYSPFLPGPCGQLCPPLPSLSQHKALAQHSHFSSPLSFLSGSDFFYFPGVFVLSARTYGVLERIDFKTVVFSVTTAAVQVSGNSTTYFRIFFFLKGSHSALRLSRHSCSSCVA